MQHRESARNGNSACADFVSFPFQIVYKDCAIAPLLPSIINLAWFLKNLTEMERSRKDNISLGSSVYRITSYKIQTKQISQYAEDSQKDVEGWRSSDHST